MMPFTIGHIEASIPSKRFNPEDPPQDIKMPCPNSCHQVQWLWWQDLSHRLMQCLGYRSTVMTSQATWHHAWLQGYQCATLHASESLMPSLPTLWVYWLLGTYWMYPHVCAVTPSPEGVLPLSELPSLETWLPAMFTPTSHTTQAHQQWQTLLHRWLGFSEASTPLSMPSYHAIHQGVKLTLRFSITFGWLPWLTPLVTERGWLEIRYPDYTQLLVRTLLTMLEEALTAYWCPTQGRLTHTHPYEILPEGLYHYYQAWVPVLLQELTETQALNPTVVALACSWERLLHGLHTPDRLYSCPAWHTEAYQRVQPYPFAFTLKRIQALVPDIPLS
ncbi:MAG: hypothetical protein ACKO37_05600 [Vampirovibrionales bacterium]